MAQVIDRAGPGSLFAWSIHGGLAMMLIGVLLTLAAQWTGDGGNMDLPTAAFGLALSLGGGWWPLSRMVRWRIEEGDLVVSRLTGPESRLPLAHIQVLRVWPQTGGMTLLVAGQRAQLRLIRFMPRLHAWLTLLARCPLPPGRERAQPLQSVPAQWTSGITARRGRAVWLDRKQVVFLPTWMAPMGEAWLPMMLLVLSRRMPMMPTRRVLRALAHCRPSEQRHWLRAAGAEFGLVLHVDRSRGQAHRSILGDRMTFPAPWGGREGRLTVELPAEEPAPVREERSERPEPPAGEGATVHYLFGDEGR